MTDHGLVKIDPAVLLLIRDSFGTDGLLLEWTNNVSGLVISEADGDIDVTLTDTGTPTFYLVLVLPNGRLVVSPAITFA